MKKFLLLAVTSVAFSSFAHAATYVVTCGNADVNDGNGSSSLISCPAFNTALTAGGNGIYVDTTLRTLSSVTQIFDGQGNAIVGTAAMTYSSAGFAFNPLISNPVTGAASILGSGGPAVGPGNGSTFNVSYSSVAATGTVGQATGNVAVIYQYNAPVSGVPEPSTLGLLGSALVGLGFISRKRK